MSELLDLVEARTVECPACKGTGCRYLIRGHAHSIDKRYACSTCHGTSRVPDPAFAPLLEVLMEKCNRKKAVLLPCPPDCREENPHLHHGAVHRPDCAWCHSTGYITHNWEGQPKGALAGAFLDWAETWPVWARFPNLNVRIRALFGQERVDEEATQVVIEAIKGRKA